MRVEDSHAHIQASQRHHVDEHGRKDGLDSIKERRDQGHHHEGRALGHHKRPDPVAISDEARARFESLNKRFSETREREFSVPGGLDPKGFLNRLIFGAFSGEEISVTGLTGQGQGAEVTGAPALEAAFEPSGTQAVSGEAGFSASVEQLSFSASGTIKTADGEEVGFTLELNITKASMSGYGASSSTDGQNGVSVNFGGSSAELFSMSFEFNMAADEEGVQSGTGSFKVDKPGTGVDEDEEDGAEEGDGVDSLASSEPDFMKLLRRAEFTSTYLSFSRTTVEASLAFAESQPVDALPTGFPVDAPQPVDVLV